VRPSRSRPGRLQPAGAILEEALTIQTYFWTTAAITFAAVIGTSTRMTRFDNLAGSILLSFALGWLLWPFAIANWIKTKLRDRAV
jgi:hypothetical protein